MLMLSCLPGWAVGTGPVCPHAWDGSWGLCQHVPVQDMLELFVGTVLVCLQLAATCGEHACLSPTTGMTCGDQVYESPTQRGDSWVP